MIREHETEKQYDHAKKFYIKKSFMLNMKMHFFFAPSGKVFNFKGIVIIKLEKLFKSRTIYMKSIYS